MTYLFDVSVTGDDGLSQYICEKSIRYLEHIANIIYA